MRDVEEFARAMSGMLDWPTNEDLGCSPAFKLIGYTVLNVRSNAGRVEVGFGAPQFVHHTPQIELVMEVVALANERSEFRLSVKFEGLQNPDGKIRGRWRTESVTAIGSYDGELPTRRMKWEPVQDPPLGEPETVDQSTFDALEGAIRAIEES